MEDANMFRMHSAFLAIVFAMATALCQTAAANTVHPQVGIEVPTVAPAALKALQKRKATFYLIDVRTPAEFAQGHISGAISFPLESLPNAYRQIPKGVKLVVYCLSGVRSAQAVSFLREHGYAKSVSLQGGYTAWQAAK